MCFAFAKRPFGVSYPKELGHRQRFPYNNGYNPAPRMAVFLFCFDFFGSVKLPCLAVFARMAIMFGHLRKSAV